VLAHNRTKLTGILLPDPRGVRASRKIFGGVYVQRRDHEQTVGSQYSLDLAKKLLLIGDMFQSSKVSNETTTSIDASESGIAA
jgi:hypothetical protein